MPRIRAATIDEHKALTRRALLDCAKSLIAEAGTAEIPLGEVALAAGVGRTTLYDYFTDRDDLIASIVEEELPDVLDSIIANLTDREDVSDRLGELAGRIVEFVATDQVLGLILHRDGGRLGVDAQARIRESHAALSKEMVGLYYQGVETGKFRSMPPDLAGRLIQDVIMSAAKTVIASRESDERLAETISNLKTFLINGLSGIQAEPT